MYYASAAVFALAAIFSVRRALADFEFRRATPASVARAVELAPSNTEYLLLRALQLDYDGADPAALLERAAALNPLSAAPRIRLGLGAEIRGDNAAAERWLLDAARIDRQFEPRWTLANFYFRRDNLAEFWKWTRAALPISYGDRRPLFDLCWRATDDAETVARAIPDQREVLSAYLVYLLETHRVAAAAPIALRLAAFGDPADRPILGAACDAFIDARLVSQAQRVWRVLYGDHTGVFHPTFEAPRIGHGFDWRSAEIPGVVELDLDEPACRRITFDGREPESCELLRQMLMLEPGRAYKLRWRVPMSDVNSGLEWRIAGAHAPLSAGELSFTASSELVPLTLNYDRPQGEPRAEGSIEISSVMVQKKSAANERE
jgi:hypothetical protein